MYFFVRVNGDTLHNDPNVPEGYVPGEPPLYPTTFFNYCDYCLENGIVRIGWPDTGDLTQPSKTGALSSLYRLDTINAYEREYLRGFLDLPVGSVILMPDKAHPGDFYMGEVVEPYHYFHDIPVSPYECAHRLGVQWDKTATGGFRAYHADALGINRQSGFWRRAFANLAHWPSAAHIIPALEHARQGRAR